MKSAYLLFAAVLLSALAACGRVPAAELAPGGIQAGDSTRPPDLPMIDGSLAEPAWQAGSSHEFEDGSQLFLLAVDGDLFLAIDSKGEGMIASNVFILEGDRVRILHTSAALGTAVYQREGEEWLLVSEFDWCCRSRSDTEGSRQARQEFFWEEGWLGANSFLGTENQLEYRIDLGEGATALAVNFILVDDPEVKLVWPPGLVDGVALPASGGFPDRIDFQTQDWFALEGAS